MGNPIFNQFGNGGGNPMLQQFQQFMNRMKGQDPTAILNNLVSNGQINQQQLNMVQQRAKEMESQFNGMRKMFGFKG